MPTLSRTARMAPPAFTPVPCEAGLRMMREPPNLAACSWGMVPLCTGTRMRFFLAASTPFAIAYDAVFVTDNDDGCKCKGTATFCHFCNAVDGNEAVFEFEVAGRFHSIVSFSHSLSEFEAGAACSISEGFNTAVEKVAVAVEYYFCNAGFESLCSDCGANHSGDFAFSGLLVDAF